MQASKVRPMLSATLEDPLRLVFPVLVSPKLDGLRCLMIDGVATSRNLKPFRNKFVQEKLKHLPTGLDGELIVGSPTEGNVLGRTQSGIMATEGEPDFTYWVFDDFTSSLGFITRWASLDALYASNKANIRVVPHQHVNNVDEFMTKEREYVDAGYEGIMVRGVYGHYKHGRATHTDQLLWKFKRFKDAEALVTGLEEGVTNTNEQTRDALGHSKRSSHQDGMVGAARVGAILATDVTSGQHLRISPGNMTMEEKEHYWKNQDKIIGHRITYKTFEYGMKDLPRFSTFKAFYL